MRFGIVALALFASAGIAAAQDAPQGDELNDAYQHLKAAEGKKDPEEVKKWAATTSKLARAEAAKAQPTDASLAEAWKSRVESAKEMDGYSEYALSSTAIALSADQPAKTVELVDALAAQNSKSKYLGEAASAYLAALNKQGNQAKVFAGAVNLARWSPDSEDALYVLASGYYNRKDLPHAAEYSNRLVAVMNRKAKPEGVAEAAWESRKATLLGQGYYYEGMVDAAKGGWINADKELRSAMPHLGAGEQTAWALFELGVADYNLSKMLGDRSKLADAVKFSQQAAGMKFAQQNQAYLNAQQMKRELGR